MKNNLHLWGCDYYTLHSNSQYVPPGA